MSTVPFVVDRADQLDELPLHAVIVQVTDPSAVLAKIDRGVVDPHDGSRTEGDVWAEVGVDHCYHSDVVAARGPHRVVWVGQPL
ncbi:MAG: hypothetical protein WBA00_11270 [Rhodococcus sp. (in: high G+C Gram-positive bacteria)]